jgi:glyoxylase-like metal-dependent hydrolase (beta-lactamase superfamily II)
MAKENIKHWKIGDVEVARIVEVNAFEDNMWMLLEGATEEFVQQYKWMVPHFATPSGKMIISFQCFVLRSKGRTVMIDTCIGADRKREYDVFCNLKTTFLQDIEHAGYPAQSINTVLCTHLHFDHVGWNTHLVNGKWVPTFPNARYLFGRKEYDHWVHMRATGGYHDFEHMHDAVDPVIEAGLVDFIGPEHKITDEVTLFPTPGHTPGHVSVMIRSRGEEAVITGDMLHHPIQFIDPQRPGNFDMDKEQGGRTRQAFVDRFADTKTLIIGSHFAEPTSGWLVRDGKAWKLRTE